ncbi:MAG: protein phosphatase 2C domain-containing protein [Planctomycetota bacterium]
METRLDAYGMTDIGKQRSENQDQFLIGNLVEGISIQFGSIAQDRVLRTPPSQGTFLIVADGMGGHVGGTIASAVAVECFARYLRWKAADYLLPHEELLTRLVAAVRCCHKTIRKICRQRADLCGMGTTFTVAYVLGRKLYVVHAGDSRCYLLRRGVMHQLTTDHTLAQLYVDSGATDASPAARKKMSHALWNCLGGGENELEVESVQCDVRLGDQLVLCSDGLSKYVDDRRICAIATRTSSVETACRDLIAAANEAGGADNITVIVGRCIGAQDAASSQWTEQERRASSHAMDDTDPHCSHDIADAFDSAGIPAACS